MTPPAQARWVQSKPYRHGIWYVLHIWKSQGFLLPRQRLISEGCYATLSKAMQMAHYKLTIIIIIVVIVIIINTVFNLLGSFHGQFVAFN